jgi:hypothetical protein
MKQINFRDVAILLLTDSILCFFNVIAATISIIIHVSIDHCDKQGSLMISWMRKTCASSRLCFGISSVSMLIASSVLFWRNIQLFVQILPLSTVRVLITYFSIHYSYILILVLLSIGTSFAILVSSISGTCSGVISNLNTRSKSLLYSNDTYSVISSSRA